MNLSFSTRGRAVSDWAELCDTAQENGFRGIEIYDAYKDAALTGPGGPLHKYNTAATLRDLRDRGLSIPLFDSSCNIGCGENAALEHARFLFSLAGAMKAEYVALRSDAEDLSAVKADLDALIPDAEACGVVILIKSNGAFSDTAALRALLDEYASDRLGVLWDIHHPYRDCGETPDETIRNLGAYVKHVHLRDSDDGGAYRLVGEGTLPVEDFMRALYSVDYDGFLSLEWKIDWMKELPYFDVILPHFVNFMSRFGQTRGKKKTLYFNHDGSGQYIWKKDELIDLTFPQVLDRAAEEFPDQYCFKYTTLDYTRTYAQFRRDADDFARALVSLGVRAGSKVAIWATNVPAWFITFWAATRIGAVLVTVNTAYKIHEAEYLLRQSDTHTL
ncbi:MAG: AMP-binding protein, partial [Clostridia bacterium]|nr:AMP-binding protein [Clostridia bacterium]